MYYNSAPGPKWGGILKKRPDPRVNRFQHPRFYSKILIDATGWHASIAEKLRPGYVHKDMLSFGIETEVPYKCKDFHFFYEPDFLKDGISWIFPCNEFSRFGVVWAMRT